MTSEGTISTRSPLLDSSAREVELLRVWGSAQRTALRDALHGMALQWSRDWSPGPALVEGAVGLVLASDASDVPAIDGTVALGAGALADRVWNPLPGASGVGWTLQRTQGLAKGSQASRGTSQLDASFLLRNTMFPARDAAAEPSALPTMAQEIAQAAWEDWFVRLAGLLTSPESAEIAPPDNALSFAARLAAPWKGGLVLTLAWCGESMLVALEGACMARWIERAGLTDTASASVSQAVLIPLRSALVSSKVSLAVELHRVEVDLGTLSTLRIGDVLRTSHDLEAPLSVHCRATAYAAEALTAATGATEERPLCDAYLGQQGERLCAELIRGAAPASMTY